METFKIQIWKEDGLDLKFSTLNSSAIQRIIYDIEVKYNTTVLSFSDLQSILNTELILLGINESDGFKSLMYLLNLDFPADTIVNVIWNYNEVDQIKYDVLQDYWDYIWYGTSDEMCLLYFPNIRFLAMLTDYGTIYI